MRSKFISQCPLVLELPELLLLCLYYNSLLTLCFPYQFPNSILNFSHNPLFIPPELFHNDSSNWTQTQFLTLNSTLFS